MSWISCRWFLKACAADFLGLSLLPPAGLGSGHLVKLGTLFRSISSMLRGGQATLFVAPGGQSLLNRHGWSGKDGPRCRPYRDCGQKGGD